MATVIGVLLPLVRNQHLKHTLPHQQAARAEQSFRNNPERASTKKPYSFANV
jgi:hypothetical protein